MDKKDNLTKRIVKLKKMFKANESRQIIIPKSFMNALGWEGTDRVEMILDIVNDGIVIRKFEDGQEISIA